MQATPEKMGSVGSAFSSISQAPNFAGGVPAGLRLLSLSSILSSYSCLSHVSQQSATTKNSGGVWIHSRWVEGIWRVDNAVDYRRNLREEGKARNVGRPKVKLIVFSRKVSEPKKGDSTVCLLSFRVLTVVQIRAV